jgi:hypothetical protein
MFNWLFALLSGLFGWGLGHATPTEKDYVGMVAAEAAYAALLPSKPTVNVRPIDPNCGTCKGTGKVPSGDGQGWSKCPTCQATAMLETESKIPKSDPGRYKSTSPSGISSGSK